MKRWMILGAVLAAGSWSASTAHAQYYGSGYYHSGSRTTIAIGFGSGGIWYGHPYGGLIDYYRVARPVYGFYDDIYFRSYPAYRPVHPVVPYPVHRGCSGYRGSGFYYYRW